MAYSAYYWCFTAVVLFLGVKTFKKLRVHFADLGNPLVGYKKYGSTSDPLNRLGLHASKLEFYYNNNKYCFEAEVPFKMNNIFKK